jgi:hypothetical protein
MLPHLVMPRHQDIRAGNVIARRLHGNLAAAADRGPKDFAELLLTPGVGATTVRALAMVAEAVHGAPYRFSDPARFQSLWAGRIVIPSQPAIYDETINVLKSAVQKAKLGRDEELGALKRLDEQARKLERHARGLSVEKSIAERATSRILTGDGRSLGGNRFRQAVSAEGTTGVKSRPCQSSRRRVFTTTVRSASDRPPGLRSVQCLQAAASLSRNS